MKNKIACLSAVILLRACFGGQVILLSGCALAQDYKFQVNRNVSWLRIDSAGQADLHYELTFTCAPGAHAIDIVDIGLPNGSYQLETAKGSVGGTDLTDYRTSEYVKPYGVEVHLDDKTIQPGDSATLVFSIHLGSVLNEDTKDRTYASVEFSPTWYGSDYVEGSTYLECNFVFPPGTRQDEPRWHHKEFSEAWYDSGSQAPIYRWADAEAAPDKQYFFGASFPAKHVDAAAIAHPPRGLKLVFIVIGKIIAGFFSFVFSTMVFWIFGLIFILAWRQNRVRRMKYLPPALSIEGVGIKRGLTAPEAALLLELPLDKALTMVLFGLVKKGAVEVTEREPAVRLKVLDAAKADQPYEEAFLRCIGDKGAPNPDELRTMMTNFIKNTNAKLKGFSRKETAAYYRQIIAQAWDMVTAAGTPELKVKTLEENNDWMMMDPNYGDRVRSHYGAGYFPMPYWWGAYGYGRASTTPSGPQAPAPKIEMPKLPGADLANTIVSGAEKCAAGLVGGNVQSFTGKITDVTNPVPVSTSSGGRGGGGSSSCACACACAGCACACAGGGR
ncbi:MAG: hypothetical protein QME74_01435 [Candidatus Edwardsbacteria bacterium]|nr:hypothetical protein [Candidatus Edwardsbacteria bacterium]